MTSIVDVDNQFKSKAMEYSMTGLFTNQSSKGDLICNEISDYIKEGLEIKIASAFMTQNESLNTMLDFNCCLQIIVRLGFPTCPQLLKKLLAHENVRIRYFTSSDFHPKLYIFGNDNMLVGSANFTSKGLMKNQEIVLQIEPSDKRFEQLNNLYREYWHRAKPLNTKVLENYKKIYSGQKIASEKDNDVFDKEFECNFNDFSGKKALSKRDRYIEKYERKYQDWSYDFEQIKQIYKSKNRRVVPEETIPLRVEVDSFISYTKDNFAMGDKYKSTPLGWNTKSKERLSNHIEQWFKADYPHFKNEIVKTNYPVLQKVFGSNKSIEASTGEEIAYALSQLHSFNSRGRYSGGSEKQQKEFLKENELPNIKRVFKYLLHGGGNIIHRMADCIHDDKYDLCLVGDSSIQELVGWVNKENLPVVNGKTEKILRFYGFDV